MARINKSDLTKLEIISVATKKFLELGYSNTSVKAICDELNMSTGNLTFHYPSKEHLLEVLIGYLCSFQHDLMEKEADEGVSSVLAICLEVSTMAAICEENSAAKDLYISAYQSPLSLEIIRKNDLQRAKNVFSQYCPEWTEDDYKKAETIVSGIEYSTFLTTCSSPSLEERVKGAVEGILTTYNVPEEVINVKIQKILATDYRNLGKRIMEEFKVYVDKLNENALREIVHL